MDLSFLFTLLKTCLNPQRANTCTKAKHNKFSILHFRPPPFEIKETGWAKWQKMGKLKSCLPPPAQAVTIFFLELSGTKR